MKESNCPSLCPTVVVRVLALAVAPVVLLHDEAAVAVDLCHVGDVAVGAGVALGDVTRPGPAGDGHARAPGGVVPQVGVAPVLAAVPVGEALDVVHALDPPGGERGALALVHVPPVHTGGVVAVRVVVPDDVPGGATARGPATLGGDPAVGAGVERRRRRRSARNRSCPRSARCRTCPGRRCRRSGRRCRPWRPCAGCRPSRSRCPAPCGRTGSRSRCAPARPLPRPRRLCRPRRPVRRRRPRRVGPAWWPRW
jgi:hypothetical protein